MNIIQKTTTREELAALRLSIRHRMLDRGYQFAEMLPKLNAAMTEQRQKPVSRQQLSMAMSGNRQSGAYRAILVALDAILAGDTPLFTNTRFKE